MKYFIKQKDIQQRPQEMSNLLSFRGVQKIFWPVVHKQIIYLLFGGLNKYTALAEK